MQMYTSGSSRPNPGLSVAAFFINEFDTGFEFIEKATKNEAEYSAVILAIKHGINSPGKDIEIFTDSTLIVGQTSKGWKCSKKMQKFLVEIKNLIEQATFEGKVVRISKISKKKNLAYSVVDLAFETKSLLSF